MRARVRDRGRQQGQGLVEISLIIPVFLLLLLAMLEFGFVFDHNISLTYATREGARVGAALVNGGGPLGCGGSNSPNASTVDSAIITAIDRVISSPGSLINKAAIGQVRIYRAGSSGQELGPVNVWTVNSGGVFVASTPQSWGACNRTFVLDPITGEAQDSIGVSITYTYTLTTPLSSIMGFFGGGGPATLGMADKTVMAMNPLD